MHFGCHVGCYWEVFLGTFPNFLKNGAPHGSVVNSDWIEGRALQKSTKKCSGTEEKTLGKRKRKVTGFGDDFLSILGGLGDHFWEPKCLQQSSEMLDAILEVKHGDWLQIVGGDTSRPRGPFATLQVHPKSTFGGHARSKWTPRDP